MSKEKDQLKELFKELSLAMGVSGSEQEVIQIVYKQLKPYADEIHVSKTGNLMAVKKGNRPGPSMMVAAHLDEVGYVVRNILPSGFITLDKVGFPSDSAAIGRRVWVSEKRIPGVIGIKPGHLQPPEEAKMITPLTKNFVDIGATSKEEVEALGIEIGDQVVIQSDYMEMANKDYISCRAVDNRIGCAVLVNLFQNLKSEDFGGTLYGSFSVREELGVPMAACAVFDYDVDYITVLDTIPVADTPDYSAANQLPMYLGKGPGFPLYEANPGMVKFQLVHPGVKKHIKKSAAEANVDLQTVTLAFAGYITDAAVFAYAKSGIPTATLTVPRRYSHSPIEMMNINDALSLVKVLEEMAKQNENIDLDFVKLDS